MEGRWPSNVILDRAAADALDQQSGTLTSGALKPYQQANRDSYSGSMPATRNVERPADAGGASRFFFVADDTHPTPRSHHPMTATIHHGDCLDVLRAMPDNSVDAVVTDPPYGLSNTSPDKVTDAIVRWASGDREYVPAGVGFMSSPWDAFVPPPAVWDECLRVLKPGGHLAVFAGSRTVDLMGISLRLAGAEVRDSIMWVHSQGFPKGKAQLKPAQEPILLCRKPFKGSAKVNVEKWGTGTLGIDACRIETADKLVRPEIARDDNAVFGKGLGAGIQSEPDGRWPGNVVTDDESAQVLDGQFGGASRFFKLPDSYTPFQYSPKAPKRERPSYINDAGDTVQHFTVKPVKIMKWITALTCPPGGTILDPFAGSGTTVEAALNEGFNVIGIEREAEYLPLIQQRIDRANEKLPAA